MYPEIGFATSNSQRDLSSVTTPEGQDHRAIDQFIEEFEYWFTEEFRELLCKRAWETPDPSELTLALLPWIDRLRDLGEARALQAIGPEQAEKLRFLINRALDGLGDEYRRWGASQGTMMLALHPIDDILTYLSLVAAKLNGSNSMD